MTLLAPAELAPRLDDDEATELEALLLELARDRAGATHSWETVAGSRALELLDQLATAGTRQARMGAGAKATAPAHTRPLPYVATPLELLEQLAGLLAAWATSTAARDLEDWHTLAASTASAGRVLPAPPAGPRTLNAPDTAAHLLARLPALIRRPGTTRPHLTQLRALVRRGRGMVDRPADRWYAGPCATPLRDDDDGLVIVDGEQAYCEEDLYAKPGAPVVVCRACTAHHRVEARRTELLRLARDRELRAVDLSRALTALGTPITADRLRQWKRRGLLGVAGIDEAGLPLYRVGDVIDLLVDDAGTAARRPARKARAS